MMRKTACPREDALLAQARAQLCEFAGGRPTAKDARAIRAWREQSPQHERAWRQACREWRQVGSASRGFKARHPDQATVLPPPGHARGRGAWMGMALPGGRRAFLSAAASAAGALGVLAVVRPPMGLWPSWSELAGDYRTGTGEQREIDLDAGTRLALNTRTSIAVQHSGRRLSIELIAGEAALSAERDSPCEVLAGSGRVSAAVADFEVRRFADGRVRVRCNAGSAQVLHPARSVDLRAGDQLFYDGQAVDAPVRQPAAGSAWRHGMVVFRDLPLAEAVDEINRYRPGRVVLVNQALATRRLSANFSIQALDEAVAHIGRMYDVTLRRVGDVVFIT